MPVTFVGDVHGWSDRLERVLARSRPPWIFVGDLIDRGPDAPGVIARVAGLCAAGQARCLLGNHEYALLRGLGSVRLGLPGDRQMFAAWTRSFGGAAVLSAYRLGSGDAAGLRAALDAHFSWLEDLPWIIEGEEGSASATRRYLAVHAGLGEGPYAQEVARLRMGWICDDGRPAALFSKARAHQLPQDLPQDCCVISGHTPMPRPLVSPQRILCDTSGGMPGRRLSAVVWPSGEVITSE